MQWIVSEADHSHHNAMTCVRVRAQELYALEDLVADYAELQASAGQV